MNKINNRPEGIEYNKNNMPTDIKRDNNYLIKILEIAEYSIDNGSYYNVQELGLDRTIFVWHVRWLMVRNFIRESDAEVDSPYDAIRNQAFYNTCYIVTPITSDGLKFLTDLKKGNFRKFLEGSPDSTAYILMKRTAEIIGYLTVFTAVVSGISNFLN